VRFKTSAQASAAVDGMHRLQFKQWHFLSALPSDENRTLFVGGIPDSWDPVHVKAVLLYAFPGMRRYARLFKHFNLRLFAGLSKFKVWPRVCASNHWLLFLCPDRSYTVVLNADTW
jgi:hypothetical protein